MARPVVEERFEYKGYPCVALFTPMAFRTGYVGLPKESKYYQRGYDDIPVECHGGLTYSANGLHHQTERYIWWIGFDCGHYGDGFDLEKASEYFKNDKSVQLFLLSVKDLCLALNEKCKNRTLDYVKENCKSIVEQIVKLEREV